MITLAKILFSFLSLINNANLSKKFIFSFFFFSKNFTNIPLQETIDTEINLILNHNPNLNINKKEIKKTFSFHYITDSTSFKIKYME